MQLRGARGTWGALCAVVWMVAAGQALALTEEHIPRAEEPSSVIRPTNTLPLDQVEQPTREDRSSAEVRSADAGAPTTASADASDLTTDGRLSARSVRSSKRTTGTTDEASVDASGETTDVADTAGMDASWGDFAWVDDGSWTFEDGFGGFGEGSWGDWGGEWGGDWGGDGFFDGTSFDVRAKASQVSRSNPSYSQWLFVPTERAAAPEGHVDPFHVAVTADVWDTNTNNPAREIRDTMVGDFYQQNTALSFERTDRENTVYTGGFTGRTTDDPQLITGAGAGGQRFTVQSEPFFQAMRGGDFAARVGVIAPQFTPYTVFSSGLGVHASKQLKHDDSVSEVQFFLGRMDRENSPSQYERTGAGMRVSNLWDLKQHGTLSVAGNMAAIHEHPESITETFTGIAFGRNTVRSLNFAYDHPKGWHAQAEHAVSDTEVDNRQVVSQTTEDGEARRQGVAYRHPKTGRTIRFEHERVDAAFTAVKGADGDDLDHQQIGVEFPINTKFTLNGTYDRVYNDLRKVLPTRSENKTYVADLGINPFDTHVNRWLKGLHFDIGGVFSSNDSRDRTLDTFNRDWKFGIAERVGRLNMSYLLAPRQELDHTSLADSWNRNKSTYQIDYTILGDKNGYWSVHPIVSYIRDHSRNRVSSLTDLNDNVNVGFDGKHGRNNFGGTYGTDRGQLFNTVGRTRNRATQLNFQRSFDPAGNIKGGITYNRNFRFDSNQMGPALRDDKVLATISRRW